jgi:hypothetical protein
MVNPGAPGRGNRDGGGASKIVCKGRAECTALRRRLSDALNSGFVGGLSALHY